jgi:hypothetical protein
MGLLRRVDVDRPFRDADAVFIEHGAGYGGEMAHVDFEEARSAVIGDFEGMAGAPGAQLAGFGGSVAAAGGAQDVPAGANAEI